MMSAQADNVLQTSDHFSLDNSGKVHYTSDVMSQASNKISEIVSQELCSAFSTLPGSTLASGPTSISCGGDEERRYTENQFPFSLSSSHSISTKNAISDNTFIDQTEAYEDGSIMLADKTHGSDSSIKDEALLVTFQTTREREMEKNQSGDDCAVSENPGLDKLTDSSGTQKTSSKSKRRKDVDFGVDGCPAKKISKRKKGLNAEEQYILLSTKNSQKGTRKKRKPPKESSVRKSERKRRIKSDKYTTDVKELDDEVHRNKRTSSKRLVKSIYQQSNKECVYEREGSRQEDLRSDENLVAFKEGKNMFYVCCICSLKFPYRTSIKKHIFLDHSKTFCALAQTKTQDPSLLPVLLLFCPNNCCYVTSKSDDFFQHIVSCKKPEINCEKDFTDTQDNFITDECEEEHEEDFLSQQVDQTSQQTVEQTGHSDIKMEETLDEGHTCQLCAQTFSSSLLLESHLQKEHHEEYGEMVPEKRWMLNLNKEQKIGTVINKAIGRKAHRCLQCGQSFSCNSHLQIHIRSHTGKKLFECEECDKNFIKKSDLVRHARRHTGEKPFKCSECGRGFASKSDVQRHMKTHRKVEPGKVKNCKDNNRFHKLIIRHIGQKPCKCELCGKNLQNERNLPRHMKTHTGERPFPCCHCDATFTDNSQLLRHTRTHTGEKPFPCNVCGKRFTQKSQLGRHIRIHTGEKPYQCSECGKNFRDGSQLLVHMRRHTGVRPHQCALCGRNFFRSSELQQHQRMHTGEKPFQCHECGKSFSLKDVLQAHMRVHTGEKPFKCKECGKYFRDNRNLYKHTRTHTGEKPFQCNECGKRFGQSNQLTRHMRTHTGERPYKCTECGKNFRDTCTRIAHMRIHTGEKPYRCNECGKSFGYSSHLNRHLKIHQREKKLLVKASE